MKSIFTPLRKEGLTTLKLRYDWRTGKVSLYAAKEWDKEIDFEDKEIDAIIDGLNLARAMSFKNIAAGLDCGGCKTIVHMDPIDLDNLEIMGFLAYTLDSLRCFTGPDMDFPTEMADVMNKHFSAQYTGGPGGPLGETGKPTAYGTYLALKKAVKFRYGSESLESLTVAVQGLGAVGWHMAAHIAGENAKMIITDINLERAKKFIAGYPDKEISYVRPEEITGVQAHVFCPCAVGGILSEDNIPGLKFDIIFGPANNQLKASSQAEEINLSKLLAKHGILFQEAWWHNTGGVLCGAEEYYYGRNAKYENLIHKIKDSVPDKTWSNLERAKELGITPTESMYEICEKLVYQP